MNIDLNYRRYIVNEIESISKEIRRAEREYMNKHPPPSSKTQITSQDTIPSSMDGHVSYMHVQ